MAGSRLERIGTIFSRVTGLLHSRAMALEDRPIWYDVYKTFPPALQPRYDRPVSDKPIRDIFYPEDVIRAKFHKHMGRKLPSLDLTDSQNQTPSEKLIERCNKLQKENQLSPDDAFTTAIETIASEPGSVTSYFLEQKSVSKHKGKQIGDGDSGSLVDSFKEASRKPSSSISKQVDIKSIFKEDT